MKTINGNYTIRTVIESDISILAEIRPPLAIHRDRFNDAKSNNLLYIVATGLDKIFGFGMLVIDWPKTWPNPGDHLCLPTIIDLFIQPEQRNQGIGSSMINWMERTVLSKGINQIFIAADPILNPRAYDLYLRLGYQPLQNEPYLSSWEFRDSDGNVHQGEEKLLDMRKIINHELLNI